MSETKSVYAAYSGNTYLFGGNAPYVEELYENYLENPGSVPETWRVYFDALQHVPAADGSEARDVPHQPVINAFADRAKQGAAKDVMNAGADTEMGHTETWVPVGPIWTRSNAQSAHIFPSLIPLSTVSAMPIRKPSLTPATRSSAKRR